MQKCGPPGKVLIVELGQHRPEMMLKQYQVFILARCQFFLVFLKNCVCVIISYRKSSCSLYLLSLVKEIRYCTAAEQITVYYPMAKIYCHKNQCDASVQYFAILHAIRFATENICRTTYAIVVLQNHCVLRQKLSGI